MLKPIPQNNTWWSDLLFLTFFLGVLFFVFLGSRPLFTPDEGRYAEIAREMVNSHNYVTPYLDGIKYFEKPVLFYWLEVGAIKLGGLNLWAIRSVNALLSILGCLATYGIARKLYGRATGLLSAIILGTSALYFVMGHMISLDLPVSVFIALTLYAVLLGIEEQPGSKRRWYFWSAAVAAACAVLTKGLIGIVFPVIIISVFLTITNEWRQLKYFYIPSSLAIFLAISVPWHWLVSVRNPEFFYFYFIEQHFLRYTDVNVGHYEATWFFIPWLIVGFFPWICFLPQALFMNLKHIIRNRNAYQTELFFLLWATLIFIFFSFSKSKLIPYILPVFPPLSILTARYLTQPSHRIGIRVGVICMVVFTAIISVVVVNYLKNNSINSRSILPLATIIQKNITPNDDVITFNQYYQDLPFYLQRRVTILNWRNELSYGIAHQDTREWIINDQIFWNRWNSNRRIYVILDSKEYKSLLKKYPNMHFYVIGKTNNNVLMTNKRPSS